MENLVFTQLSVSEIRQLFRQELETYFADESQRKSNQHELDGWFNLNELCNYLPDKPAKATVYNWVHTGLIPCHKGQKKLRFLKSEIDNWLKQGRKKTIAETSIEADNYLSNHKKGLTNGK